MRKVPAFIPTMKAKLSFALMAAASAMAAPGDWSLVGRSSPDTRIRFMVAVRAPSGAHDALTQALYAVADPISPTYGQHLTKEAVERLTAPKDESVRVIADWLDAHEAVELEWSSAKDWVSATIPVSKLEAMLKTEYHEHVSTDGKHRIHRCVDHSLPADVAAHVDFVGPVNRFPPTAMVPRLSSGEAFQVSSLRGSSARSLQSGGVTPAFLRKLYGIGDREVKNSSTQQVATGYLGQFASPTDLQAFYTQFYPAAKGRTLNYVGPNQGSNPGTEASLDVQYITALGGGANTTFWYTDGTRPGDNEPYAVFLSAFSALPDSELPRVLSTSYSDNENSVDYGYAARVGLEFQKLGARGVSVIFSSGDGGVSGSQSGQCTRFIATFPSALPWVTAVGGTQGEKEVCASFSGGGFSDMWPRSQAPYQKAAVDAYLAKTSGLPPASQYNGTLGAGFPDVAASGVAFNIIVGGGAPVQVDGTSCSTPTFAGIVTLLNDARAAVGKGPLGWLNPLIYAHPEVFNDVTEGNNPGCGTNGFPAAPGWDPVTGMGTPNFPKMLQLVMSLP